MVATHPQAVLLLLIILVAALMAFLYWLFSDRQPRRSFSSPEKEIPEMPQHKAIFVDLSPKSADVVELAVEVWRINNRVMRAVNGLTDTQKRGLESSLQKFIKFLDRYDVKIVDHTGEKYNEGMNVDYL